MCLIFRQIILFVNLRCESIWDNLSIVELNTGLKKPLNRFAMI